MTGTQSRPAFTLSSLAAAFWQLFCEDGWGRSGLALGWQKRPEKLLHLLHFEALRREMAKNLLCH
jgi:hypothetical protein